MLRAGQWRKLHAQQTHVLRLRPRTPFTSRPTPLPTTPAFAPVPVPANWLVSPQKKCQRQAGGVAVCRNARRFFSPFSLRWNAFRWIRNISFRCHFPLPISPARTASFFSVWVVRPTYDIPPSPIARLPVASCRVQAQDPFHSQRRSKKVLEMFYVLIAFCWLCLTHSPTSNQKRDQTWVSRWFNGLTSLHFPLFHFFFPIFFLFYIEESSINAAGVVKFDFTQLGEIVVIMLKLNEKLVTCWLCI